MRRLALVLTLIATTADAAGAQGLVRVRVGRPTTSANGTLTAAVTLENPGDSILRVTPGVDLPPNWRVVTGASAVDVPAGASAMTVVAVSMPSSAAAGSYALGLDVMDATGRVLGGDTLRVAVPRRRALELTLLERPNFVVSGRAYDARFLLRNTGNANASVALDATSAAGTVTVAERRFTLEANASRLVQVHVVTRSGLDAATDDVLELAAHEPDSATAAASTSARVTIVPEPNRNIEEFVRVPARVNLRAASSNAVAIAEAFGRGRVRDGSSTELDFLLRGPTGPFSPFGERDEYRAALTAPSWRLRAGDQTYMLSPLTSAGQPGFGLGADVERGMLSAGAYGQRFRRALEKGNEAGAFVSWGALPELTVGANAVSRTGGPLPGNIGSATMALQRRGVDASLEMAASSGDGRHGVARNLRASGALGGVSYDFAHLASDTGFAGAQRGARHNYLITHSQPTDWLALGVSGSMHRVDLAPSVHVPYEDRLDVALVSATLFDRFLVEGAHTVRGATTGGVANLAAQNSVRGRMDRDAGFATVSVELEAGKSDATGSQPFTDATLGARRGFGAGQGGLYVQRYSGGSVLKGDVGGATFGGDATLRLGPSLNASVFGSATRQQLRGAEWHSQLDLLVTRALANGASISLRARVMQGGTVPAADQSVAYLEYGLPLRLPVSRLRTPGRVYGRVVDASTGRGIPNALVRLGPQMAITDGQGDVAFGGVPAGEHRLSMSQETSFANAVFVDDPTISVDATRTSPTTFEVAVARSARVDIDVHRFASARTAAEGVPDSLADAGAVPNATLVLAGERDTLFRTTDDAGRASFTDIPPGHWMVAVRGDAPAFHRFDPDRMEIDLRPGDTRALSFRLVPRKREVQMIGETQDLRAAPAEPKAQAPAATPTKTVKPNEQQQPRE